MQSATDIQQPLPVDTTLDFSLTLAEVEAIVGRGKSWIYAEVKRERFPAPDDGRWYASEIADYMRRRREGLIEGTPRWEAKRVA